jgi:hypothetical protein
VVGQFLALSADGSYFTYAFHNGISVRRCADNQSVVQWKAANHETQLRFLDFAATNQMISAKWEAARGQAQVRDLEAGNITKILAYAF